MNVWHRVRLMVAQGVATVIGADVVQATELGDEPIARVKRIEPYGLSSRPKPGAQVYMVFPSGDRARGLAFVIGDKRYEMELLEGEVALHDDEENFVKLGHGGVATVRASSKVVADTPIVETTGDVRVGGNLLVAGNASVGGQLTQDGVSVGHEHVHVSNRPGVNTSPVVS